MSDSRAVPRVQQQFEKHLAALARDVRRLKEQVFQATAWISVSGGVGFQNSWVNFGAAEQTAQYRKIGDLVYLRGTVKSGTTGVIFTLPVGYRPPAAVGPASLDNTGVRYISISSNGNVSTDSNTPTFLSLNIPPFSVAS